MFRNALIASTLLFCVCACSQTPQATADLKTRAPVVADTASTNPSNEMELVVTGAPDGWRLANGQTTIKGRVVTGSQGNMTEMPVAVQLIKEDGKVAQASPKASM